MTIRATYIAQIILGIFGILFLVPLISSLLFQIWGGSDKVFITQTIILGLVWLDSWSRLTQNGSLLNQLRPFESKVLVKNLIIGGAVIGLALIYTVLNNPMSVFQPVNGWNFLWVSTVLILQVLLEELLFRQILIGQTKQDYPNIKLKYLVVISALIFSLFHLGGNNFWLDLVNLFLFGLVLGMIFSRFDDSKGIWASFGIHIGWNLTYFLVGIRFPIQSEAEILLLGFSPNQIFVDWPGFWITKTGITLILLIWILHLTKFSTLVRKTINF